MGLATARLLASRGARISLGDINEDGLETASSSLPSRDQHIWAKVDVQDTGSVDMWIRRTVEELGRLDGAVNMAGIITPARPITEQTDLDFGFSMDVNALGVFRCLRAQLRLMSRGGSIVSTTLGESLAPRLLTGHVRSQPRAPLDSSAPQATPHIARVKQL